MKSLFILSVSLLPGLLFPALAQTLTDPSYGNLSILSNTTTALDKIDGLAFDSNGNLFGALEIFGSTGGIAYIDKSTGTVTSMTTGISRADQLSFAPNGKLYVTSEVSGASTSNRIYEVSVNYSGSLPISATTNSLTTSNAINNPEGLIILSAANAYGTTGTLIVAEHLTPGTIWTIDPITGTTSSLASGFSGGEGMAFGNFGLGGANTLFVAETSADIVTGVNSDGSTFLLGDPTTVGLDKPDNVTFGPDGYLYVSEDKAGTSGRILRVDSAGNWEVFATGFDEPQGMVFDTDGTMYLSEQGKDRIWKITPVPEPQSAILVSLASLTLLLKRRR